MSRAKKLARTVYALVFVLMGTVAVYFFIALVLDTTLFKPDSPEYNLRYTDARYDCSEQTRAKHLRQSSDKCVIIVTVTNPYDQKILVDYAKISGPGFVDFAGQQRVKIYGVDGKRIDAHMTYVDLPARSTLPMRIFYQKTLAGHPTTISIDEEKFRLTETQFTTEEIEQATETAMSWRRN